MHSYGSKKNMNIIEINLTYLEAIFGGLFNLEVSFGHLFIHSFSPSLQSERKRFSFFLTAS